MIEQQFHHRQLTLPVKWSLSYEADEYVVTDCNSHAFNWLEKWPFRIRENFACLVGDKGAGKTHLAGIWAKRVGADVFNAKSEIFEKWFRMSSEVNSSKYYVLDDADLINDDVLLFYIYNSIKEHDAYMLLTAKTPPIKWDITLPDVRSRFVTINVLKIQNPSEDAIHRIIKQMLKQRGLINVPENTIDYLANTVERSYESINYWIQKIDSCISQRCKFTTKLVKEVISSGM
jgi:chromosomal replication initiation ATPase DnaA